MLGYSQQDVSRQYSRWCRAVSLLCVLLTLLVAAVQVTHVHNGNPTSADRDCSICSVAHSAVRVAAAFQYAPAFGRTAFVATVKESLRSFLSVSCLYIRPPPAV